MTWFHLTILKGPDDGTEQVDELWLIKDPKKPHVGGGNPVQGPRDYDAVRNARSYDACGINRPF